MVIEMGLPPRYFYINVLLFLFQVSELGKSLLPPWLEFDNKTRELSGIAGQTETDRELILEVTPVLSNGQQGDKDIFSIRVAEEASHSDTAAIPAKDKDAEGLRPIQCPSGSSVTMASIIVDTDVGVLRPRDRVSLVEGMERHLKMPPDLLHLMPMGNRPMFDSAALVAGPGDTKKPQHSGLILQWNVGCGNVFAEHMPILQLLETTSHDGSMGSAVGHGIVGWHVTNNKPHAAPRVKRRVQAMATAMQTEVPTDTIPRPTRVTSRSKSSSDSLLTSRVIPTMQSPSFTEIQPTTSSEHHHHHHRTKTTGRHHHHSNTHDPKHSPKESKTRVVMGSPTIQTITPTRVVGLSSTTMEPSMGRSSPSAPVPSRGVSRTDSVVQPSMTATSTVSISVQPTQPLPSRSVPVPRESSTTHIHPTSTEVFTPPTKEPPIFSSTKQPVTKETTTTTQDPLGPDGIVPGHPSTTTTTEEPEIPDEDFDYAPQLTNTIPRIELNVGEILNYTIPADTFYDKEDGNTRNLKLIFLTVEAFSPTPDSWVVFDEKEQRLIGLPLLEHAGRKEFLMIALDSKGKIGRDAFEIYVKRSPVKPKISHEFVLTLDDEYDVFANQLEKRLELSRKIARLYGDNDLSKMMVTRLDEGSVIYGWTNKSLPADPCPESAINQLMSYLFTPNNTYNEKMLQALSGYKIKDLQFVPQGSCRDILSGVSPPPGSADITTTPVPSTEEPDVAREKTASEKDNLLITTVVPAVIIIGFLLIAGIVACIMYRMRRRGKLSDEDQSTFINKGIPIIFQDELEEQPEPPTKPLIMDDERAPLPPPAYPISGPSTPRSDRKEPPLDSDDEIEDATLHSPLYRPPPPVTGSLGSRGSASSRPRTNSAQRSPPPYVPP